MVKLLMLTLLTVTNLFATNISEFKQTTVKQGKEFPGWCSEEKREALIDSVLELKPTLCVEIGVYGGKSLFPIAAALKFLEKGQVIGIDPWELEECTKHYTEEHVVTQIWKKIDLEDVYLKLTQRLEEHRLLEVCQLVRLTSKEAAPFIEEIDLLHIDGNHSEASVYEDVTLYFPKVKQGGYIWLDDVLRETTRKPYEIIQKNSTLLRSVDRGNSLLYKKN